MNGSHGIMAAPNQCEIEARVLGLEQSPQFSDKWLFEVEILASQKLHGPNFAQVGNRYKAFTFESIAQIEVGSKIKSKAEYIGDAHTGQFQLTEIELASNT